MTAIRRGFNLLGILSLFKAASKGPRALARNRVRAAAHRGLARMMRRRGW